MAILKSIKNDFVKNLSEPADTKNDKEKIELGSKESLILIRFVEVKSKIKDLKKEEESLKEQLKTISIDLFGERVFSGKISNFNITSGNNSAMFMVNDAGGNISEKEYAILEKKWTKKKIEKVVELDAGSIRFDEDKLKKHMDVIYKALMDGLSEDVRNGLFKPFHYTAKKEAIENIKSVTKTKEEFIELLEDVKITTVLK